MQGSPIGGEFIADLDRSGVGGTVGVRIAILSNPPPSQKRHRRVTAGTALDGAYLPLWRPEKFEKPRR